MRPYTYILVQFWNMLVTNLIYLPLLFVNCGISFCFSRFSVYIVARHSSQPCCEFGNCPAIDFVFLSVFFIALTSYQRAMWALAVVGRWIFASSVIYWYNFVIKMKTFTIRIFGILFMSSSSQLVGCARTLGNLFNCRHPQNGVWDICIMAHTYMYISFIYSQVDLRVNVNAMRLDELSRKASDFMTQRKSWQIVKLHGKHRWQLTMGNKPQRNPIFAS